MNNERYFQISADFDLSVKPLWLDEFRLKYDQPYDFHITLKTTSFYKSEEFENLKIELRNVANKDSSFSVIFDELAISSTPSGWCIMLNARPNEDLNIIQKEISEKFSKFGKNASKEKEDYEINFTPYITIARHLNQEQLGMAKKESQEDLLCEAVIDKITLATVNEDKFEEWSDSNNRISYQLSK